MPKTKTVPNKVAMFEIAMKNRTVITVEADAWNFSAYGSTTPATFMLNNELVMVLHPAKWEYIRLVKMGDKPE